MGGEWRDQRWGDLATLEYGRALRGHDSNTGRFRVFGTNGPIGWHDEALCPHPGVIIGRKGAYRGVHYSPEPFFVIDTAFYLEPKSEIELRWAYYELLAHDINTLDSGSAIPSTSRESFYSLPVRVPPVAEQRAIAHILGTLDDKIEVNRRMSQTLEATARALFESWFVRFDPVRRNMARKGRGQPSPAASRHPLPLGEGRGEGVVESHAFDHLFPDRLVDSELGEIPEGWEVGTLPELIQVNPGRPLRKGDIAPYLDMANMPTRGHAPDLVTERPFGSGMRFMNGDTLVARITPCLENGKTAFVDFLQEGQIGWGSTEFIVLRPKPPLPEEFAYCLARSEGFREFAIQSMTGSSGRQRVPAESLGDFQLVVPSQPVAEAFGRQAKALFARASAAVGESRTLAALRDALLPKLISGEIRVNDAERFLKERGL